MALGTWGVDMSIGMRATLSGALVAGVLIAGSGGVGAQSVESGFVNNSEFKKPTFAPGDEQVARDFAKGMGSEFNKDMELPSCMWRTRTRSAGGFADGYSGDDGYAVFARIPVPAAGTRFDNLTIGTNPTTYRPEFPREAFLQFHGLKKYDDPIVWTATLVLPQLEAKDYPLGPPFRVATVKLGGYEFRTGKPVVTRGIPTHIDLPDLEKAVAAWDGAGGFEAAISPLAPASDAKAPRVKLAAVYPELARDIKDMQDRLIAMIARDRAKKCAVFPRECRDGECGL